MSLLSYKSLYFINTDSTSVSHHVGLDTYRVMSGHEIGDGYVVESLKMNTRDYTCSNARLMKDVIRYTVGHANVRCVKDINL